MMIAASQKLWYFTDQNGPKGGHVKMNFQMSKKLVFSNSEMNDTSS